MKCLAAMIAVGALAAYGCNPWLGRAAAQTAPAGDLAANAYPRAISAAVADFEAGRFEQALAGFNAAHALQPSARTWRGIGLASYSLQDFARARRAFERALIDPRRPLAEAQRAEVEALLRETAQHTGRFELHVHPADARVDVDGATTSERELVLSIGEHRLLVSAPGHAPQQKTLQVAGAEVSALTITLAPNAAAAPTTSAIPAASDTPASEARARTAEPPARSAIVRTVPSDASQADADGGAVLPWVVLGATPVFLASAGIVWWSGLAKRDAVETQCARDACTRDEANQRVDAAHLGRYETWTNLLLGASLVTTGIALVILAVPSDTTATDTLALRAGPTGLRLDGHF